MFGQEIIDCLREGNALCVFEQGEGGLERAQDGLVDGDPADEREVGRFAEGQHGPELRVRAHQPGVLAGAEVEHVAVRVEVDLARPAREAEQACVPAQRLGAGFPADAERDRDGRRGETAGVAAEGGADGGRTAAGGAVVRDGVGAAADFDYAWVWEDEVPYLDADLRGELGEQMLT